MIFEAIQAAYLENDNLVRCHPQFAAHIIPVFVRRIVCMNLDTVAYHTDIVCTKSFILYQSLSDALPDSHDLISSPKQQTIGELSLEAWIVRVVAPMFSEQNRNGRSAYP